MGGIGEMAEVKNILNRINELRENINSLVVQKHDLLDPEVLYVSEELDELVNFYMEQMRFKNESALV
jgi:stage 0 sporulation regulatory protein